MSKWYTKIKDWYDAGYWTKTMVKNAVIKKRITADEYKTIVGEDYVDN